jgi:hypothetical protein
LALTCIVVSSLATSVLGWNDGLIQADSLPPFLDDLRTFMGPGLAPAMLLLAGGYLALRFPSRTSHAALILGTCAPIFLFAAPSVHTWTTGRFNAELRESFAGWRARIPAGSDVLWVSDDSPWGDGALNTWLLLQRPSFLAGEHAPNALFSRAAAIEMRNRARAMWGLLPFVDPFRPRGEQDSVPTGPLRLAPVCATVGVRYVVTLADMIDAVPIPAPSSAPPDLRNFKLYICT